MLRRPRTWLIIGSLIALPTLVAVLLAITDLGPRPGTGPPFLSAVLSDGTLFPLAALGVGLRLLLPIAVAVLGGDAIAGESQTGTLRYLLVRPVGVLTCCSKLVTVVAFVLLAVLVVAVVSYAEGRLLLGQAPTTGTVSLSGSTLTQQAWLADRTSTRVRDHLDAWRRSGRVVLLYADKVFDRRSPWHGRDTRRFDRAVGIRCANALHPFLPTRHWLAFSTCSAIRSCGEM